MDTIVSGVRPTGHQHLGNYFGAIRNFVRLQEQYPCYYFVADYHSLTTHPNPADLQANVKQILVEYLACGVDPEKSVIYVQSDIPQIPELYLLFNMLAYKGELERSVTFKEKARTQPDNINAGLLTYPVLMAVDILIHRATKVPVGKDQKQHLEMTRDFAKRFNSQYNVDFFPEPEAFSFSDELVKVPGLDGKGKMSKSDTDTSAVYFIDDTETIRKKVMRAVTDSGPVEPGTAKSEPIANLFALMDLVSSADTVEHFAEAYDQGTIRYGDMKKALAEDMDKFVDPIRTRIKEMSRDIDYLSRVTKSGEERGRESAKKTLDGVRQIIGLNAFTS